MPLSTLSALIRKKFLLGDKHKVHLIVADNLKSLKSENMENSSGDARNVPGLLLIDTECIRDVCYIMHWKMVSKMFIMIID